MTVHLRTERLLLRPWEPGDAPAVHAACQDPDILRFTRVPSPYTPGDATSWVSQTSPAAWTDGSGAHFGGFDPETGALRVSVGARLEPAERWAEIGYFCVREARGRGLMTEAARAVAEWLVRERGVERVEWRADTANAASRRVAERAGFRTEGVLRRGLFVRGERVDCWVGSLLPDDLGA